MNDEEIKAIEKLKWYFKDSNSLDIAKQTYIVLNLIEKQKADIKEYEAILDIGDNRKYRKKYLEERRKEEPNLLYPDADEIYERYYKQKEEIEKLNSIVKIDDIISKVNAEVMEELRVEIKTQKERIEYLKRSIDRKEDSLIEEYQNNVELETKLQEKDKEIETLKRDFEIVDHECSRFSRKSIRKE